MVEHHQVILAAEAALFISPKWSVGGVVVVVVDPDAACLDGSRDAIKFVGVAGPDPGAETVKRVIGDGDGDTYGERESDSEPESERAGGHES